jgi:hypothetical protein
MTEENTPLSDALMKNYWVMGDCSTRRSIIAVANHCYTKDLDKYENNEWSVKFEGSDYCGKERFFKVTNKKNNTEYLVTSYGDRTWNKGMWSVYLKKVKKDER